MLSKVKSTQKWLLQFLPEHRRIASSLLDSLHIITTEDMIEDLKLFIEEIANNDTECSALLPIREVTPQESIYNEENPNASPLLQASQESLGSEAFISNLYTNLNRSKPNKYRQPRVNIGGENRQISPSIEFMKQHRFKHLFLVDDLIGSGDRVVKYLNALLKNKTINSWVSYGFLKIHIVSFMATQNGKKIVLKRINGRNNISLHIIHHAPSIHELPNNKDIIYLCEAYAHKQVRYPLGYKDCAVRVVFTHSAPNNLPSILHYQVENNYRPSKNLNLKVNQWHALFPFRTITSQFKHDVTKIKSQSSPKHDILSLLTLIESGINNRNSLANIMNKSQAYIQTICTLCEDYDFISNNNNVLKNTDDGRAELATKTHLETVLAKSVNFYYPRQ